MNATTSGLVRTLIRADEIQIGDRLDSSGKTRVARRHDRVDDSGGVRVLVQTKTIGTRSPSIRAFDAAEPVNVWRKPTTISESEVG